jgi:hypothetical protein
MLFMVLAGFLMEPWQAFAADLNAPAEKKPTIGSELERGYNVVHGCNSQHWDTFYKCISIVIEVENRKNTDTDLFLLGVYAGSMVRLTEYEQAMRIPFSETNGKLGLIVGKEWYLNTVQLQRRLDISDQQLASTIQTSPALVSKAKVRWSAVQ